MNKVIRKIDNLGRIVIPKDIRNNLNLLENDEIEINEYDGKYMFFKHENNDYDNYLLNKFSTVFSADIFISNKERIISRGYLYNKKIPLFIINSLKNRNKLILKNEEILFEDIFVKSNILVLSIYKNSSLNGYLFLLKTSEIVCDDECFMDVLKKIIEK